MKVFAKILLFIAIATPLMSGADGISGFNNTELSNETFVVNEYTTNVTDGEEFTTSTNTSTAMWPWWPSPYWIEAWLIQQGCIKFEKDAASGITFKMIDCNCIEKLVGKDSPIFKAYCGWTDRPIY
ncbi:MAG: hypothetical protein HY606_00675 [Planctomycetes bacterium]|nr:hypothetical protein [Planctomycetota bacterium]